MPNLVAAFHPKQTLLISLSYSRPDVIVQIPMTLLSNPPAMFAAKVTK